MKFHCSVKQLAAVSSTGCVPPALGNSLSVSFFPSLPISLALSRSILLPQSFSPLSWTWKRLLFNEHRMEVLWLGFPSEGLGVIWPAQLLYKDFSFLIFVFRVIADSGYGQIRNNYCQKCIQWCLISLIVHCQFPNNKTGDFCFCWAFCWRGTTYAAIAMNLYGITMLLHGNYTVINNLLTYYESLVIQSLTTLLICSCFIDIFDLLLFFMQSECDKWVLCYKYFRDTSRSCSIQLEMIILKRQLVQGV